jgi:hypothetical protein
MYFSAAFQTVSVLSYTPDLLNAIVNETKVSFFSLTPPPSTEPTQPRQFWGPRLSLASATFLSYDVEPFLPSFLAHGTEQTTSYPPSRARTLLPLNLYFAWGASLSDDTLRDAIVQSAEQITQVAVGEGQDVADAPLYGNYAIESTPLERIFGDNIGLLEALKAQYDPEDVMGLAGGWKF